MTGWARPLPFEVAGKSDPACPSVQRRALNAGIATLLLGGASAAALPRAAGATAEDIADFIWAPTRDRSGNILESSWAALPTHAWVEVADTSPVRIIAQKIIAAGFPFTPPFNSMSSLERHVGGSFNAWVSGALDSARGKFYVPWGGGHGDGALNGVWRLDLPRMVWEIQKMPSHPQANGYEWTSRYVRSGSYTQYVNEAGELWDVAGTGSHDALPDGRPTSRHQYEGVVYDSARNVIMQHRLGRWSIDLETNVETSERYRGAGLAPGKDATDQHCYYDPVTGDVFAANIKLYDYWGLYRITPGMAIRRLASAPKGFHFHAGAAGRLVGREILFIGLGSSGAAFKPSWSSYHIDANRWTNGPIENWPSGIRTTTMQAMEWVADVGKFLFWHQMTWRFFWITPGTWAVEEVAFSGKNPPPAAYTGHKFFYWPARKLLVAALGLVVNAIGSRAGRTPSNVYVMKIAE